MTVQSVSGKNWKFKEYNSSDIRNYSDNFLLSEIVAKLISIRKKNIVDVALFLDPKVILRLLIVKKTHITFLKSI